MSRRAAGPDGKGPGMPGGDCPPADAAKYGIADGDQVRVRPAAANITVKAQVSPKAMPGTVFLPFHFAEASANKLTNAALDPVSKIPEYKVCAVQIEKADPLRRPP